MQVAASRTEAAHRVGPSRSFRSRPVSILMKITGAAVLVAAGFLYFQLGGAWWMALVLLLGPDLAFLAFLFGTRAGVKAYNAAHRPLIPLGVLAIGLAAGAKLPALLALIWIGHIGMDRAVGYGLKEVITAPSE